MSSSIESKSDIQARPEHLQQFGVALRAAKPKGPVSGVVALGFNVRQTPAEGLELATAFLITCQAQRVSFEQLPGYEQDQQTITSIWNMGRGRGPVAIFYLPDMTRLADIDVASANNSWGRHLQDAVIKAKVDLTARPV